MLLMMNLNKYSLRNCTPLAVKWQQTVAVQYKHTGVEGSVDCAPAAYSSLWYAL
jgi:hypothetical protein